MIYLSDDYVEKYISAISYLIGRSCFEGYSFDFIEKSIAYSSAISEFERSNVTLLAFSSIEKTYNDIFPSHDNEYNYSEYDIYGWVGFAYVHLFLSLEITFEALFYVIPIEEMLKLYSLYHEMDINRLVDHAKELMSRSILDVIMKKQDISNRELSDKTQIPVSTINSLRYGIRDISKLEANKLLVLSRSLNVKMETLLHEIYLKKI